MDIQLSRQVKSELIEQIKKYHLEERDQTISDFQAENFLLFMINAVGPAVYNQAIEDAYALMSAKAEELYGLQKRG